MLERCFKSITHFNFRLYFSLNLCLTVSLSFFIPLLDCFPQTLFDKLLKCLLRDVVSFFAMINKLNTFNLPVVRFKHDDATGGVVAFNSNKLSHSSDSYKFLQNCLPAFVGENWEEEDDDQQCLLDL